MPLELDDITQYLKEEAKALIPDDENWAKEATLDVCKICGGPLVDDDHFHLYREVQDETWCMDFSYACAIIESHADVFREDNVDGVLESH